MLRVWGRNLSASPNANERSLLQQTALSLCVRACACVCGVCVRSSRRVCARVCVLAWLPRSFFLQR